MWIWEADGLCVSEERERERERRDEERERKTERNVIFISQYGNPLPLPIHIFSLSLFLSFFLFCMNLMDIVTSLHSPIQWCVPPKIKVSKQWRQTISWNWLQQVSMCEKTKTKNQNRRNREKERKERMCEGTEREYHETWIHVWERMEGMEKESTNMWMTKHRKEKTME